MHHTLPSHLRPPLDYPSCALTLLDLDVHVEDPEGAITRLGHTMVTAVFELVQQVHQFCILLSMENSERRLSLDIYFY